jgi:hypothetical protein
VGIYKFKVKNYLAMSTAMYQTTSSQEQAKDLQKMIKVQKHENRGRRKIDSKQKPHVLLLTAALLSVVCPMYLTL